MIIIEISLCFGSSTFAGKQEGKAFHKIQNRETAKPRRQSESGKQIKAANAPNESQSRGLCGFVKLKAKMMKTRELITTSDHRP